MVRSFTILLIGLSAGFALGAIYKRFHDQRANQSVEEIAEDVAKRLSQLEDEMRAIQA